MKKPRQCGVFSWVAGGIPIGRELGGLGDASGEAQSKELAGKPAPTGSALGKAFDAARSLG
ncbi:MAG: hypothetical protein ACN6O6_01370 [Pseudomonas sp.]|uniref:hypothetical protein n=1 Tax=Pseudomonas sp. TaxID=306 RepID=UPI003D0DD070